MKRRCHYCGGDGATKDHIVPQTLLRQACGNVLGNDNVVYSCADCNLRKDNGRSDCDCLKCVLAWSSFGPLDRSKWPPVKLSRSAA